MSFCVYLLTRLMVNLAMPFSSHTVTTSQGLLAAGTGFAILNMPLSRAEFERWDAASVAIDGMRVTEPEDD